MARVSEKLEEKKNFIKEKKKVIQTYDKDRIIGFFLTNQIFLTKSRHVGRHVNRKGEKKSS